MRYRPTLLAEEYYPAYWWELLRMNSQVISLLNSVGFPKAILARHQVDAHAVADLAGISVEQLISDHSLAYYREVGLDALSWSSKKVGRNVLRRDSFKLPRVLRFCEDCCEEDISFHGRAYYRRSHQMPGVNWCRKHGFRKLLWTPPDRVGVMRAPDEWVSRLEEQPGVPGWESLSSLTRHFLTEFIESSEDASVPGYFIDVDVLRFRWSRLQIRASVRYGSVLIRSLTVPDHPGFDGLEIPCDWLDSNFRFWKSTLPVGLWRHRVLSALTPSWLLMTTLAGVRGSMHTYRERPATAPTPIQMSSHVSAP